MRVLIRNRKSPSRKHRKSPSRKRRKSPSRKRRKSPSRKRRKSPSRKHRKSPSRKRRKSPSRKRRKSPSRKKYSNMDRSDNSGRGRGGRGGSGGSGGGGVSRGMISHVNVLRDRTTGNVTAYFLTIGKVSYYVNPFVIGRDLGDINPMNLLIRFNYRQTVRSPEITRIQLEAAAAAPALPAPPAAPAGLATPLRLYGNINAWSLGYLVKYKGRSSTRDMANEKGSNYVIAQEEFARDMPVITTILNEELESFDENLKETLIDFLIEILYVFNDRVNKPDQIPGIYSLFSHYIVGRILMDAGYRNVAHSHQQSTDLKFTNRDGQDSVCEVKTLAKETGIPREVIGGTIEGLTRLQRNNNILAVVLPSANYVILYNPTILSLERKKGKNMIILNESAILDTYPITPYARRTIIRYILSRLEVIIERLEKSIFPGIRYIYYNLYRPEIIKQILSTWENFY